MCLDMNCLNCFKCFKCFKCFCTKSNDPHSKSSFKGSGESPVHTVTSQPNPRHEQQSKQDCKEIVKVTQFKHGWAEGISRGKLKKDLIPNPEVFHKIDTHAINAGRELRFRKIFSVQKITETITEGAISDLDKLRAIWIWLCHYIEYDHSRSVRSPEQVILTGRGVCSGYSSVCLQMCRTAGIECREVSGYGKGASYQQGQSYQNTTSNHMWNAVCLDGRWYLLDACWGTGHNSYEDFYFLTDPEDFINTHFPEEKKWQLLESPIELEEFEKSVLKSPEFYRLNLTLIHPKHFLVVTENGEAMVSMTFPQLVHFNYRIFQVNGNEIQELSNSMGFLTSTQHNMKLRIMPPKPGMYELELCARTGNTSEIFNWICSFQLECPSPKTSEELPAL